MATDVAFDVTMISRNQNILGPSTTAFLDPCFIQLVALLNRKIPIIVKSGVSMTAACKCFERIKVAFDCIPYRDVSRCVPSSARLQVAKIECDPDVNEPKTALLRKSRRPLIGGTCQEIQTLNSVRATPFINLGDRLLG
jgi:hypothetical protein